MNRDELRLAIRQRSDMVGSLFVTDPELDLMIDSSVADLHDILVAQYGDEYWSTTTWIQIWARQDESLAWPKSFNRPGIGGGPDDGLDSCFALPSDFLRLVRCQFLHGTATRTVVAVGTSATEYTWKYPENWTLAVEDKRAYPMHRIDTAGQVIDSTPQDWHQTRVGYRIRRGVGRALRGPAFSTESAPIYQHDYHTGTIIEFLPIPTSNVAVQVTYVPIPSLLPDHPFPDYLIFDCAALCLEKQRSDSSALRALQERVKSRISSYSRTPDAAHATKVVDVYGGNRIGVFPPWSTY